MKSDCIPNLMRAAKWVLISCFIQFPKIFGRDADVYDGLRDNREQSTDKGNDKHQHDNFQYAFFIGFHVSP